MTPCLYFPRSGFVSRKSSPAGIKVFFPSFPNSGARESSLKTYFLTKYFFSHPTFEIRLYKYGINMFHICVKISYIFYGFSRYVLCMRKSIFSESIFFWDNSRATDNGKFPPGSNFSGFGGWFPENPGQDPISFWPLMQKLQRTAPHPEGLSLGFPRQATICGIGKRRQAALDPTLCHRVTYRHYKVYFSWTLR